MAEQMLKRKLGCFLLNSLSAGADFSVDPSPRTYRNALSWGGGWGVKLYVRFNYVSTVRFNQGDWKLLDFWLKRTTKIETL